MGLCCAVAKYSYHLVCRHWKVATVTAGSVYKYVLAEFSLKLSQAPFPRGFPLLTLSLLLHLLTVNIYRAELLREASVMAPAEG